MQTVQIVLLVIFKNYLLYLVIQLSITFFANILIMLKSNKDYPYLKEKYSITKEDINKRNMIPDVKNFLVHKISYAVYGGTDNIVISAICGIRQVAIAIAIRKIYGNSSRCSMFSVTFSQATSAQDFWYSFNLLYGYGLEAIYTFCRIPL